MFGTSIHWTTFFYLLIDTVHSIAYTLLFQTRKRFEVVYRRFLYLSESCLLLIMLTGGFLPIDELSWSILFLQYIITYGVAIALCVYIVYYLYKEYDIVVLKVQFIHKKPWLYSSSVEVLLVLFLNPLFPDRFTWILHAFYLPFLYQCCRFCFSVGMFLSKVYRHPSNPNEFHSKT